MGGGNGAKAAQARERNAKANAKGPTSQLASNAKAMTTQCKICLQTFQSTLPPPQLKQHQENKHPKQLPSACFPGVTF